MNARCIFRISFCGDFIEICRTTPPPRDQGQFFLAFRKKGQSRRLLLFTGITGGGAKRMIQAFKERRVDLTALCAYVVEKLRKSR